MTTDRISVGVSQADVSEVAGRLGKSVETITFDAPKKTVQACAC